MPFPPDALAVTVLVPALHKIEVLFTLNVTAFGCVIVTTALVLQLLISEATIVYVPAAVANGLL